jgi:hypothetical protein
MSPGKQPAAVQRQPYPDPSKDVAPQRQPKKTAISKSERYREILAVLARHGIGVVDDELIKHQAGDRARAEHLRKACEELGDDVHQARANAFDAQRFTAGSASHRTRSAGGV